MMFVMGFYGVLMVLMVYQWCFMVFYGVLIVS